MYIIKFLNLSNKLLKILRRLRLQKCSLRTLHEKGATIFDSLLMAIYSENDQIISSDNIYEKFGFDVIDLKKK